MMAKGKHSGEEEENGEENSENPFMLFKYQQVGGTIPSRFLLDLDFHKKKAA